MDLQVLVATMNQKDLSLIDKMNIRQNVLIANQCGFWKLEERQAVYGTIQMLSSNTVGVGNNRNLALQLAQGDILLFADDDITYYDGTLQGVLNAFSELPDADAIFFGLDMTRNGTVHTRLQDRQKRVHIWNSLKYGAPRMAIRRSAVIKQRLSFSTLFGGGCKYGSGEDSLLICDCFRRNLKIYAHPYVLGACAEDTSTWFAGYNAKYVFDRGAFVAAAFPRTRYLMGMYYLYKDYRKVDFSLKKSLYYMNCGMKAYSKQTTFSEIFEE